MAAKAKTAEKIGVGDEVMRRTEKRRWESPLKGEVKSVLDNGKLLVRWEGAAICYWRDSDGKTQARPASAVTREKPSALLPATEKHLAASQRRIDKRLMKAHQSTVTFFEEKAAQSGSDSKHYDSLLQSAEQYREKLRELERKRA